MLSLLQLPPFGNSDPGSHSRNSLFDTVMHGVASVTRSRGWSPETP